MKHRHQILTYLYNCSQKIQLYKNDMGARKEREERENEERLCKKSRRGKVDKTNTAKEIF